MKITTLMDDHPSSSFKNEHGLSFYIQAHNTNILFDTGASSLYLENARKLSLSIEEVDTLIISHGHYDHTGGLSDFLKINKNAKIYMQKDALLPHYHDEKYIGIDPTLDLSSRVTFLSSSKKINDHLYLLSELSYPQDGMYEGEDLHLDPFLHEQSLIIDEEILIAGCAHNGIMHIINAFYDHFHHYPRLVIGGFHLRSKKDLEGCEELAYALKKTKATFYTGHCTSDEAYKKMKPIMNDQLHRFHIGESINH